MAFGISGANRQTVDLFIGMTGASRSTRNSRGNAMLEGHPVQIRFATTPTLNQIRAAKYWPVVVYYEPDERWYVVPPHIVVKVIVTKRRGQHQEVPFETATLNLRDLTECEVSDPEQNLRTATLRAIAAGGDYPEIPRVLATVRERSRALARRSRKAVADVLSQCGIV